MRSATAGTTKAATPRSGRSWHSHTMTRVTDTVLQQSYRIACRTPPPPFRSTLDACPRGRRCSARRRSRRAGHQADHQARPDGHRSDAYLHAHRGGRTCEGYTASTGQVAATAPRKSRRTSSLPPPAAWGRRRVRGDQRVVHERRCRRRDQYRGGHPPGGPDVDGSQRHRPPGSQRRGKPGWPRREPADAPGSGVRAASQRL